MKKRILTKSFSNNIFSNIFKIVLFITLVHVLLNLSMSILRDRRRILLLTLSELIYFYSATLLGFLMMLGEVEVN